MFEVFGLDQEHEAVYEFALSRNLVTAKDVQGHVGPSPSATKPDADALLSDLAAAGLLVPPSTGQPGYVAIDPAVALADLLRRTRRDLIDKDRQLADLHGQIPEFAQAFTPRRERRAAEVLGDALSGDDAIDMLRALTTQSREILTLRGSGDQALAFAAATDNDVPERPVQDVSVRAVYDRSFLSDVHGLALLEHAREAGEVSRVVTRLPMSLVVIDARVAVLLAEGHDELRAILIRSPTMVGVARDFFEQVWLGARRMPTHQSTQARDERDRAILTGLAGGQLDAAIAERLGVATRTVRRRITDMMETLGCTSRFQLAIAARQAGWL